MQLLRSFNVCLLVAIATVAAGCLGSGPTGLTCTSDARGNHLTWDPLPNATGYNIYRTANVSGNTTGPSQIGNTTSTSFTDSNVTQSGSYLYFVTGTNGTGQTAPTSCNVVSVPFFPSTLALGAAIVGSAGLVGIILLRRNR